MIQKYCVKHSSRNSTLKQNMKAENSSYISTENTEDDYFENKNADAGMVSETVEDPPKAPVKPERTKSQNSDSNFSKIDDQCINKRNVLPRNMALSHDIVETYSVPDEQENNGNKENLPKVSQRRILLPFLITFEGALYICELLGSTLCWILLVVWSYAESTYRMPPLLGASMFIFVTSWITTTLIFLILLLGADSRIKWMEVLRSNEFGLANNFIWTLLYVVAGGISASFAVNDMTQVLGASTAIAFIVLIFYFTHFLTNFYKIYKKSPCAYLATCSIVCEP